MRRHLLYVGSPKQVDLTRQSLEHFQARLLSDKTKKEQVYVIEHSLLGSVELSVHLLADLNGVVPHLRQWPVDLLVYDERGEDGHDAVKATHKLSEDIDALARLWGVDFHFPMRRIVAILNSSKDSPNRSFILGRYHVRDVLVGPKHLGIILRWIGKILTAAHLQENPKTGCALSGGGLEGFLFQLGTCHALSVALQSQKGLSTCHAFAGVSSGSMVAATLASEIPVIEVIRSIYGQSKVLPKFSASMLYDFAGGDIAKRITKQTFQWSALDPLKWIQTAAKLIPTGFFKGDGLLQFVRSGLQAYGRDDSFLSLNKELYISVTHQDTFEPITMGHRPWDFMKISDAVRASSALPPIFTPYEIGGQNFIDGQISTHCDLEILVKRGCHLIFIIDPLIPYTDLDPGAVDEMGGVYTIIQTLKTLIHTRFHSTLKHLTERYPDVDFMIFQPYEECAHLMRGSPMKYKANEKIIELAYKGTLRKLHERYHVYAAKLEKYGFKLAEPKVLSELENKGLEL